MNPKAICHAGSSDWKYSSGWKKVLMLNALRIRNAIRNSRISREIAVFSQGCRRSCCISSKCLSALDAWSFAVDDMPPHWHALQSLTNVLLQTRSCIGPPAYARLRFYLSQSQINSLLNIGAVSADFIALVWNLPPRRLTGSIIINIKSRNMAQVSCNLLVARVS